MKSMVFRMKKTRKAISFTLVLCIVIMLFGGCSAPSGSEKDLKLKEDGVLTVGMEFGYSPFELYDDDGKTETGLDVEFAKELASTLGLEVKFVNVEFDAIATGLDNGDFDIAISALNIPSEENDKIVFSDQYAESWQAVVVKKNDTPVTASEDFDGKTIICQIGTTANDYLDKHINGEKQVCHIANYTNINVCFEDLYVDTRIDAIMCDRTIAEGYTYRNPDKFEITWLQNTDSEVEPECFGAALKKGNQALLEAVNAAIGRLKSSGKLNELYEKWFQDLKLKVYNSGRILSAN